MEKTDRGFEERSKKERSELQTKINKKIWASYTEEERLARSLAISKAKIGKLRGKFSVVPPRNKKCGYGVCDNLVYEKILQNGGRKWNKYCCKEHSRLGAGKNITKANTKSIENKTKYYEYRKEVYRFTFRNNLSKLVGYEKRGKMKIGTDNYNLDHIYSIYDGYTNKVDPSVVGNIENLRFIPWKENRKKGNISHITLNELIDRVVRSQYASNI